MKRHLIIGMHLAVHDKDGEKGALIDEHIAFAKRAEAAKLDFLFKADYLMAHPELMAKTKGTVGLDPSFIGNSGQRNEANRISNDHFYILYTTLFDCPSITILELD